MTPRPGAPVPIVVTKYDGRRRFRVETRCLVATPRLVVLRGEPGRPFVAAAGTRRLATTTLEYFPRLPGHWYNVVSFFDTGSGALERHFCNILAPWRWDGATLEYVDLDLDLVVAPDGALTVEDVADFRRHAREWRYPPTLRHGALAALRELRRLAASGRPPFTADPLPVATARALAGEVVWERGGVGA